MFKSVLAAQLTSLMVWISLHYKDKVGGFLFSAEDHLELKPKTNQQGTLRLLKALSTFTASLATHQKNAINHSARPLHEALGLAKQIIKPGSLVILISDFYTLDSQAMTWLARLKAHSQIAAYRIADPFELALPPKGHYPIQDLDQKRAVLLNLKSQSGRQQAQNQFDEQSQWIQSCFQQLQAPFHCVSSTSDWIQVANATFPRGRHHG